MPKRAVATQTTTGTRRKHIALHQQVVVQDTTGILQARDAAGTTARETTFVQPAAGHASTGLGPQATALTA